MTTRPGRAKMRLIICNGGAPRERGHEGTSIPTPSAIASLSVRKKVLVVASRGGGAHASAASAVASYLEPAYAVRRVDPLTELFSRHDPLRWVTFGRYGGEDFYNFLLARGWHRLATVLCDRYGA